MRIPAALALLAALAGDVRSRPHPRRPAPVFSYTASDGEFGYALDLAADRRWSRSEHSGSAKPAGRLSPASMRRFLALLAAAPFREGAPPDNCTQPPIGFASYRDLRGSDRSARADTPCGATVDAATARLATCLEMLIEDPRSSAATAECALPAP